MTPGEATQKMLPKENVKRACIRTRKRMGRIFRAAIATAIVAMALIATCSPTARAAAPLAATVDTVRFGAIREADGPKSVRMYVRNVSDTPTSILKVRPTCGCTAADFDKEEIQPGDSARIELTYDPARRPGRFEKGVRIYPVEGDMIRVPIEGVVFASPSTIESMFPADAGGGLHLSESTLMTLKPLDDAERTLWIDTYNGGESTVTVKLESSDAAMTAASFPEELPPGERGLIGVYIHPLKERRQGAIEYTLLINSGGEPYPVKILTEKP